MQKFYDEEPSLDFKKNHFKVNENFLHGVSVASLSVKNLKEAKELQKEIGEYEIVNSPFLHLLDDEVVLYTQKVLKQTLKKFIDKKPKKVLIVGLGNQAILADAFGGLVVESLTLKNNMYLLKPDVYGNTNIMSFDLVCGVVKQIAPDLVILIDSLATSNIKRLACSFQFCDIGILPGGALSDVNKIISEKTLGVSCVVIGAPFMIFANGLNSDLDEPYRNLILTAKDIDEFVLRSATMVAEIVFELV